VVAARDQHQHAVLRQTEATQRHQAVADVLRQGRRMRYVETKLHCCCDFIDVLTARSRRLDEVNIAHEIESKGAALKVIEQAVDTSTTAGRAFFGMLSVFAQFETDVRRERQTEGIEAAKQLGKYKGRKPTAREKSEDALTLLKSGVGATDVARQLVISRRSVYRIVEAAK
jgi:DNA invertase Pin-like site-specific DNA recombinase